MVPTNDCLQTTFDKVRSNDEKNGWRGPSEVEMFHKDRNLDFVEVKQLVCCLMEEFQNCLELISAEYSTELDTFL